MREFTRDRPWESLLTGKDIGQIDAATRQAPGADSRITEVVGLVVHTAAGKVSMTRDFPSDYTSQVDRLLGEIFKNNRCVTGIEFLGMETPHTATPDDPYWSPQGKAYASIERAAARGETTPEEAIAACQRFGAARQ